MALVMAEHAIAERYACKLLEVDRSSYRYEPRPDRNAELRAALWVVAKQHSRYGYRRLWALLVRQGWEVDVKRIHRLYKAEGIMVRRLKRKRLSRPVPVNPRLVRPNQEWAMDFVSDARATGRALRTFNLIDSYTKESLAIEVGTGISSRQVTRVLERVMEARGVPGAIRCDYGRSSPACTSRSGAGIGKSQCITYNRVNRYRTGTWKASTDDSGTSA